ncbi:disulfide oxidoreductase [Metabacillus halosaccharovorans]|uniref:Probable disulfide formation protein n=1 Tax=Metabacillus halosaccharovorans TaxID=930124 RepID=A0ABT3DKE5_9BACI|nr:disulfide oxidoreductase [Metabacillus halosaccharovorans]MCV9886986.1 disulfide oxidoreductase [Metabacillus halosaccharovorans]
MNKWLLLSWIISLIATLGSLFFSEVLHYIPCTLCWYQRILMYPLTIILGVAFYYGERTVYKYVLPIAMIGMATSFYHYTLQKLPFMQKLEMCSSGIPCSGEYINVLGFITIPFLAFISFTFITINMLIIRR